MYGLDKNEDLGFLVEKELEQVCVGRFDLILNFTDDATISLQCEFDHQSEGESIRTSDVLPDAAASLLGVLGNTIVSINNPGDGSLEFTFSGGSKLIVYDSNGSAESYQIESPNGGVIV